MNALKRATNDWARHSSNGHKMVTRLWETSVKYDMKRRERIEKARGGKVY